MCAGIRDGSAMDVIEMDAASETGIDDVREKIIENAKFAPAIARFKVYIIDEVHDLSLKAFDSLLKTIEEPPAHVAFILATTEAHKVPITVRSRCQRMDFRRGTLEDLTSNLKRVLEAEKIAYQPEAVAAVARAAEGSFRDSLSILEQVLAFTDGELTADAVHSSIGTVGSELLDEVTRILASDDMNAAFLKADELVDSGKDVRQTLIALQNHLRDLMVASVARNTSAIPEATPERFAHLKEQAALFTPSQILKMLEVLAESERDIRFSNQHRLILERAFWSILPSALAAIAEPVPTPAPPRAEPAKKAPALETTAIVRKPSPELEPEAIPPMPPLAEGALDLDGIRRIWPRVLKRITQGRPAAAAALDGVRILGLEGSHVILGCPNSFSLERADRPQSKELVERALGEELRATGLKVRCRLADKEEVLESAGSGALEFGGAAQTTSNGAESNDSAESNGSAGEPSILKAVEAEFGDRLLPE
jgi:DNA polymerase-3 subunit gamma/tau